MKIQEIAAQEKKTNVYKIYRGKITPYQVLGTSGPSERYLYLIDRNNYGTAIGIYIPSDDYHWEIDYEKAIEVMWEQSVKELKNLNDSYFNNTKNICLGDGE